MKHRYLAIGSIIFLILILRKNKNKTPAVVTQVGDIKRNDITTMEIHSDDLGLLEKNSTEELKTEHADIASNNKEEDKKECSKANASEVLASEKKEAIYEETTGIFTTGGNVSTATNGENGTTTNTTPLGGSAILTTAEEKPSPLNTDNKVSREDAIINKLSDIESKIGGIGCCNDLASHVVDKEAEKAIEEARNEHEEVVNGVHRMKVFSEEFDNHFS